ncbi:phosphotransferase [bacterium]|nr:phosphotransferase [bacterium]
MLVSYLTENWERLQLQEYGNPSQLSVLTVTPRFRASAHLLFFVLNEARSAPFLVAKVPRIVGDNARLTREFENLTRLQSVRPQGFDSVPRIVAYEDYKGNRVLIQTALINQTMRPAVVRKNREICVSNVHTWLIELHQQTMTSGPSSSDFDRLVTDHLDCFEQHFPISRIEEELVAGTRELANELIPDDLVQVFEHGDLSSPNILMDNKKKVGVVDWELADPHGLPAVDLFFFLTYIAFAKHKARSTSKYLQAFRECFFGTDAWAIPHIVAYREQLGLSSKLLKPLFVLCWSRYVTSLLIRLCEHADSGALSEEGAQWLRANRYFALWRYAMKNIHEIAFG